MSKRTSSRGSSVLMSERKIEKIGKLVSDKKRGKRRENIIKGIKINRELSKERIKIFLKSKLRVETKVKTWKVSGEVIVIKLENKVMKREVMKNKNKLKGGNIFIENYLSLEDTKIQEVNN